MKMEVFLYNSTVCRLCGEENDNGTLLYSGEENSQNLSDLINTYLPLKVKYIFYCDCFDFKVKSSWRTLLEKNNIFVTYLL